MSIKKEENAIAYGIIKEPIEFVDSQQIEVITFPENDNRQQMLLLFVCKTFYEEFVGNWFNTRLMERPLGFHPGFRRYMFFLMALETYTVKNIFEYHFWCEY